VALLCVALPFEMTHVIQEWALWNGLADCYEQGLVRACGVSNYGARELRRVAKDFGQRGVPLASAQVSLASNGQLFNLHRTASLKLPGMGAAQTLGKDTLCRPLCLQHGA
jgi:diketogulonate reductase-like aldo/keto reductase